MGIRHWQEMASVKTRVNGIGMGLAAVLLLAVGGCRRGDHGSGDAAGGEKVSRPNVIICLVDTLRRDHLGLYGYSRDTSPRLEAFAADAVVFDDARAPSSWTKPSTGSLLTGMNPIRHGAVTRTDRLDPTVKLLGTYLKSIGYHTSGFVTNPNAIAVWGFDQGFDAFYDLESTRESTRADRANAVLFDHLSGSPGEPFFYYLHTLDPHSPYDPPAPFDTKWRDQSTIVLSPGKVRNATPAQVESTVAAYDGEISFSDHHFGAMLDELKRRGLYNNSLIVFTSDHGEEFLEHGFTGHGHSLYEEQLRIPLVIKFPKNGHAGRVVHERVSLIDIVPTLLAMLGLETSTGFDGLDLGPLLKGGDWASRSMIFGTNVIMAVDINRTIGGIMAGDFKYLRVHSSESQEFLFNVREDPWEMRNLMETEAATAKAMARDLDTYTASVSGGVHVWLVNGSDRKERVMEVRIRTEGKFEGFRTSQFEDGDMATLSKDRQELNFKVVLRNHANPILRRPRIFVDDDRMTFRVDPPDATVVIESLTEDGEPGAVFLGASKRKTAAPATFGQADGGLEVGSMGELFKFTRDFSIVADAGAYVGVIAEVESGDVEMDEKLRDRLKALGYVD
jgi:arylsulfatase A-like enzyme